MKVFGAIVSRKAASGRIQIVSFKRKNSIFDDLDELKAEFPPEGFVFAPTLAEKFAVDDLVEFQTIEAPYSVKPGDDAFILDRNGGCNYAGYEVINCPDDVMIEGASIDPEQIDQSKLRPNSEFYLQVNQYIYGPFKKQEDYIQPVKEVFQIPVEGLTIYPAGGKRYLLGKPLGSIKCDAMDREQLGDWMKDQLRALSSSGALQSVRETIQTISLTALDGVRMNRALRSLDQILLNQASLKAIAESLPQFKSYYESALEKVHDEIAAPLLSAAFQLEQQIDALTRQKEKAGIALTEELNLLENARLEVQHIALEKYRLISDIRVHALVDARGQEAKPPLLKYEIQDYLTGGKDYLTFEEFANAFKNSLGINKEESGKAGRRLLLLLKDYRCLLTAAIKPVLQIARLSNNSRLFLQQVEPDWLKYDSLYENGLKQCWESAWAMPEVIHFFILEDLNLSSPECYAKPLNDLLAGVRHSLPGLTGEFPENLWIFGVPLATVPGSDFGLPLLKSSFIHWGAVPIDESAWEFTGEYPGQKLTLPVLTDHHDMVASKPDDYFLKP